MSFQALHQLAQPLLHELGTAVGSGPQSLFVTVDSRSGAGKSTLAGFMARDIGSTAGGAPVFTVIEGDQFYAADSDATWDGRSAEEKVAGGIDWCRQRAVLEALRESGQAEWRTFDWESENWDADVVPLSTDFTN